MGKKNKSGKLAIITGEEDLKIFDNRAHNSYIDIVNGQWRGIAIHKGALKPLIKYLINIYEKNKVKNE